MEGAIEHGGEKSTADREACKTDELVPRIRLRSLIKKGVLKQASTGSVTSSVSSNVWDQAASIFLSLLIASRVCPPTHVVLPVA